jgi:hypothetical protein
LEIELECQAIPFAAQHTFPIYYRERQLTD